MNQSTIIKKISLKNFQIINSLEALINNKNISDDERKILKKEVSELKKNDKLLLKTLEVKFTDKEKKQLIEMIPLLK